jgi:hypothetical protein
MLKILCQELPLFVAGIFKAVTDCLIRRRILNSPDRK